MLCTQKLRTALEVLHVNPRYRYPAQSTGVSLEVCVTERQAQGPDQERPWHHLTGTHLRPHAVVENMHSTLQVAPCGLVHPQNGGLWLVNHLSTNLVSLDAVPRLEATLVGSDLVLFLRSVPVFSPFTVFLRPKRFTFASSCANPQASLAKSTLHPHNNNSDSKYFGRASIQSVIHYKTQHQKPKDSPGAKPAFGNYHTTTVSLRASTYIQSTTACELLQPTPWIYSESSK